MSGRPTLQLWDTRGWALNVARLRLELYRVVAAILASRDYDLSQLQAGGPARPLDVPFPDGDALGWLAANFQDGEIEHGLISVAATTRVLLDQVSPRPPEGRLPCGTLIPDSSQPQTKQGLTLCEA